MKEQKLYKFLTFAVLGIPILWLIIAACIVEIDYYDSYDVILNTCYFFGEFPYYLAHKAPMLSVIMIPARGISKMLHLNSLDLTVYHALMATLHILYLLGVFYLLTKHFGRKIPVIIAFTASILSFVFFSYGLFMNIDIFPGFLFLLMIFLAHSFMEKPNLKYWLVLVAIGAIAALLKQTFGLSWFAVLIAYSFPLLISKNWSGKDWRSISLLVLGSASSFLIYWIFMGIILQNSSTSNGNFFSAPFNQLISFSKEYKDSPVIYPLWIYIRNLPCYGFLTTFLIIPGVIMNFRSKNQLEKAVAISWVVIFICMHLIVRREVRYIAFMAPLSAFLLIAPIKFLVKQPKYLYLILGVLAIDFIIVGKEALRIRNPFYRHSQLKKFLEPIVTQTTGKKCVINEYLCFIPPYPSPFVGDHYHRKFHFSPYHIKFFASPKTKFQWQPYQSKNLFPSLSCSPESYLVYSNFFPMNLPGSPDLKKFILIMGKSEKIPFEFHSKLKPTPKGLVFSDKKLSLAINGYIFTGVVDRESQMFPLVQLGKDSFIIQKPKGYKGELPINPKLKIFGYKILKYVFIKDCGTVLTEP